MAGRRRPWLASPANRHHFEAPPSRLLRGRLHGRRRRAAITPLARGKLAERVPERGLVEVRQMNRQKHELSVGGLPEQEIRKALLAGCADYEIRVGNARRVETRL